MNRNFTLFQKIARNVLTINRTLQAYRPLAICHLHICHRQMDNGFANDTTRRQFPTGSCLRPWLPWLHLSRHYAKKLSFHYSGDLTRRQPLDEQSLVYNFKGLTGKLQQAPESVQRLSSLEFADGRCQKYHRKEEMYDRIEELFGTNADLEQKIAKLTVDIRSLIPHCLKFRQDKYVKSQLVDKIQMRKKLLKYLRRDDYQRFLWLLRELRIRYIPAPEYYGQVTRKFRKKRAVVRAAFEVRKQKLFELRERLEAERVQFEYYKEKTLDEIEKDINTLTLDLEVLEKQQCRTPMTKFEAKTYHLKHKNT